MRVVLELVLAVLLQSRDLALRQTTLLDNLSSSSSSSLALLHWLVRETRIFSFHLSSLATSGLDDP